MKQKRRSSEAAEYQRAVRGLKKAMRNPAVMAMYADDDDPAPQASIATNQPNVADDAMEKANQP